MIDLSQIEHVFKRMRGEQAMKLNEHEKREKLINAIIDLLRCLSMDRLRKLYITALVWAEKE